MFTNVKIVKGFQGIKYDTQKILNPLIKFLTILTLQVHRIDNHTATFSSTTAEGPLSFDDITPLDDKADDVCDDGLVLP